LFLLPFSTAVHNGVRGAAGNSAANATSFGGDLKRPRVESRITIASAPSKMPNAPVAAGAFARIGTATPPSPMLRAGIVHQ